jgi:hypothetical protein
MKIYCIIAGGHSAGIEWRSQFGWGMGILFVRADALGNFIKLKKRRKKSLDGCEVNGHLRTAGRFVGLEKDGMERGDLR